MGFLDPNNMPLPLALTVFCASAVIVWFAGSRLAGYADRLAGATGLGGALVGFVVLGGITSLPEIATSITASVNGDARLGINNLVGSTALQLVMLALVDAVIGKDALTSTIPRPDVMVHAALNIVLLTMIAAIATAGDWEIPGTGVGIGAVAVFFGYAVCVFIASNLRKGGAWAPRGPPRRNGADEDERSSEPVAPLAGLLAISGIVILVAGYILTRSGQALSEQTGLGSSFFGFIFLGAATSLPEASSAISAVRRKRPQLAIGDVLGGNLFNLMLVFLVDVAYRDGPALNEAGQFGALASMLATLLCAILLVGMLERRDKVMFRMGYDTSAMLVLYLAGTALLYQFRP